MPFSSKVFRNLKDSIVGVKEQDEDPLKTTRLAITAYSKDSKALCQTLQDFAKANDELDGVRGEVVNTAKAFLLPMDQEGGMQVASDPELTKVGNVFSAQIENMSRSKTETRKLLDDAISEASGMERRLADINTAFGERDKAAELVAHYKEKMQSLNEEHLSKPKKDMDDRIKRNLVKQQDAVEAYNRVDNQVRADANQVLEGRQTDFAKILDKMCMYLAKNGKTQGDAVPAFEEQIPAMIRESQANLERTRAAREAAKAAALVKPAKSSSTAVQQPTELPSSTPKEEEGDQASTTVNTPTVKEEGDGKDNKVDDMQKPEGVEEEEEQANKKEAASDLPPMRSADSLEKE